MGEAFVTCEDCEKFRVNCHEMCKVIRENREERLRMLEKRMESIECKLDKKLGKLNNLAWAAVGGLMLNFVGQIVSHYSQHLVK